MEPSACCSGVRTDGPACGRRGISPCSVFAPVLVPNDAALQRHATGEAFRARACPAVQPRVHAENRQQREREGRRFGLVAQRRKQDRRTDQKPDHGIAHGVAQVDRLAGKDPAPVHRRLH